MLDDSANDATDIDAKIAYHQEMEHIAIQSGDFTKAEHHRRMEELYVKMKKQQNSSSAQAAAKKDRRDLELARKNNK